MADTIIVRAHVNAVIAVAVDRVGGSNRTIRRFADGQAIERILV